MSQTSTTNPTTPHSSINELHIGGLRVHVFGLDEAKQQGHTELGVLYLAHGRTRSYKDSEALAHRILHLVRNEGSRKKFKAGLIVVALDARNHGERKIQDLSNRGWHEGNETHAQDMLSVVCGSAHDYELLIDYLPSYLPDFHTFYNFMSGISLGGHTTWRMATSRVASKGNLHGVAMIIGCPKLTCLMLSRLGVNLESVAQEESIVSPNTGGATAPATAPISTDAILHTIEYETLLKTGLKTDEQRRRWPRALAALVSELDRETEDSYPRDLPTYILNGEVDALVPNKFTEPWVKQRRAEGYSNIEYFVQENTGHECTMQMVDLLSKWLVKLLN